MAVVAQLGSVAYKIAIEKDWIVVIAHGNTSALTSMFLSLSILVFIASNLCFIALCETIFNLKG